MLTVKNSDTISRKEVGLTCEPPLSSTQLLAVHLWLAALYEG